VWLRYTLRDGPGAGCALWCVRSGPDGVDGHREPLPLSALTDRGVFDVGDSGSLSATRALGRCGPYAWDLHLRDRGRVHAHVPKLVERLGIGRHYAPGILDLRATGTVTRGDEIWQLSDAPGVLGHIHGSRNRTRRWAWAHCASFEGEDAVFEGLSVELGTGARHTPPLTSLVLHLGGRAYRFSRTRDLVLLTRSRLHPSRWTFHARRRGVSLSGEVELAPERVALVRYAEPDGGDLWCRNAEGSRLRLVLEDRRRDLRVCLRSDEAAFELASRERPEGRVVAG
jgi:hypothetical protein